MTDQEEMVNMAEAMAQECIKKIELQAELKFVRFTFCLFIAT